MKTLLPGKIRSIAHWPLPAAVKSIDHDHCRSAFHVDPFGRLTRIGQRIGWVSACTYVCVCVLTFSVVPICCYSSFLGFVWVYVCVCVCVCFFGPLVEGDRIRGASCRRNMAVITRTSHPAQINNVAGRGAMQSVSCGPPTVTKFFFFYSFDISLYFIWLWVSFTGMHWAEKRARRVSRKSSASFKQIYRTILIITLSPQSDAYLVFSNWSYLCYTYFEHS